jgi:iron-sulfur cluster assembly protein
VTVRLALIANGNDIENGSMGIQLTESAARQIQAQLAKRGGGLGLRVGIKKVGCSGFAYTYDYADEIRPDDHAFESHGTKIVVDGKSLQFLEGSTLDYTREALKQAFKFHNPNVDATCGCGESVSFKDNP